MKEECRICLILIDEINRVSVSMKLKKEMSVLQVISECASIEILDEDPLSKFICNNCLEKLKSFHEFRQLIVESDTDIKQKLSIQKHIKCESDQKTGIDDSIEQKAIEIFNEGSLFDCSHLETDNADFNHKTDNFKVINQNVGEERNLDEKLSKNLQKFKKTKQKTKIYECKECDKKYKKADHYKVHMTKHTGEKKYACEFCPKRFARSYVLVYHRRVHTGEKPYTCEICSKNFTSPSNFYTHKKIHTGKRNYKCDLCDESFIQSDSLKIHIRRIHTGERPFLCEICSSAFRSSSTLFTHKLDVHEKKEECPVCNNLYSIRVLKEHVRRHQEREQGIKRYACDQCGKRFTCSSSRKKHLLIHSGEKPYSCEICKKSFNQTSALKTHMRIHSDVMPFSCDLCTKSFRYKHHLRAHFNNHHKEVLDQVLPSCS